MILKIKMFVVTLFYIFYHAVYHFSLLICYPCSFHFHALILVAHWECKLPPLNGTGKDYKLTTDFEKILTFSLAREFDLVLSLGVTTPLITRYGH